MLAFVPSMDVPELEDFSSGPRRSSRLTGGAALISESVNLDELNTRYHMQAVKDKGKQGASSQAAFETEGAVPARFILGSGAYGQVVRAKDASGRDVAIKIVDRRAMALDSLQNEVEALTMARRHPNVTELVEVLFCPETDRYYLVTEFCGGGELFDRLIDKGPYSELEAAKLVERIASALDYLHSCGFAHMDVKPENLMFSGAERRRDGDIRLIDFGMCKRLDSFRRQGVTHMTSNVGTTPYLPSEILNQLESERRPHLRARANSSGAVRPRGGEGHSQARPKPAVKRKVNIELRSDPRACDMWSLGIIIYILLLGCHPFDRTGDAEDDEIAARAVMGSDTSQDDPQASPPRFTFDVHRRVKLSAEARDLITRLLDPNPATRLRSDEVIKHPWLQQARRLGLSQHRSIMSKWAEGRANMDLKGASAARAGRALERDTLAHRAISSAMLVASLAPREDRAPAPPAPSAGELAVSGKEASLAARDHFLKQAYSVLKAAQWGEELQDNVDVFKLPFEDFVRSVKRDHSFKYASGETIFEEGDDAEGIFILLSGRAQIEYSADPSTHASGRHIVSQLQSGDVFGEAAVLDGRDFRNATVRCLTPVRVLFWSRDDFVRVMCGTNALCLGLEEHLRSRQNLRARRLLELMDENALKSRHLHSGETLYKEGDAPDALYVLEQGVVRTSINTQSSRSDGSSERLPAAARVKGAMQRFLTRVQERTSVSSRAAAPGDSDDASVPSPYAARGRRGSTAGGSPESKSSEVPLREYNAGALVGTDALAGSARIATATCVTDVEVTVVDRAELTRFAAQESSLQNTILRLSRRDNEEKLARLRAASTTVFRDFEATSKPSELSELVRAVERQLLRRKSMQIMPEKRSGTRSS